MFRRPLLFHRWPRRRPFPLPASSSVASFSSTPSPLSSPAGDRDNLSRRIPSLTDFPELVYPNVAHTLRNWFLAHFLITPYFDTEFRLAEFSRGVHRAIDFVSHRLSRGDLSSLEGPLSPDCLRVVSRNLSLFLPDQRSALAVKAEDIYALFVYQVGVLEEGGEGGGRSSRDVEITVVAHTVPGFRRMTAEIATPVDMKKAMEEKGGPIVLNYRFIRDFSKEATPEWTINALNHFYMVEKES